MTEYRASAEDMQVHSDIIRRIAMIDIERNRLIAQLQEWEQAHIVPEAAEPSDAPIE